MTRTPPTRPSDSADAAALPAPERPYVIVINPLAEALDHYTETLGQTLREAGAVVEVTSEVEPSRSARGRMRWVVAYLAMLIRARRRVRGRSAASIVVTWPVLGYFDLVLLAILCRGVDSKLVVHDPTPLVRAIGHSAVARRLGAFFSRHGSVVVHSDEAIDDLGHETLRKNSIRLPLPIDTTGSMLSLARTRPVVRVLGQFKPERDLDLMARVAASGRGQCDFEVFGRGWPPVEGWRVTDRFLTDDELDRVIRSSSVVLIPYRRFYQSDIAVRCLESGVPFVGARVSSLVDLCGPGSPLLIDPSDLDDESVWLSAISASLELGAGSALDRVTRVRARGVDRWRAALAA